jgi:hypothetical protein
VGAICGHIQKIGVHNPSPLQVLCGQFCNATRGKTAWPYWSGFCFRHISAVNLSPFSSMNYVCRISKTATAACRTCIRSAHLEDRLGNRRVYIPGWREVWVLSAGASAYPTSTPTG